jgi:hypothetical protein
MLNRILLAFLIVTLAFCDQAVALRIDITQPPYSADRTGATDAAPAFRAAIAALKTPPNHNGGVIYVPAGRYMLNSVDPQDLANPAGVIIDGGSIALVGESNGRLTVPYRALEWGSVIFAGTALQNAPMFLVAKDPGFDDLSAIEFSNLKITRGDISGGPLPQGATVAGMGDTLADGIVFRPRATGALDNITNVKLMLLPCTGIMLLSRANISLRQCPEQRSHT